MEKNLTIKVDDRLIDLINKVEDDLRENPENLWHFPISWAFSETGDYANGLGSGIEYGCSIGVGKNGEWQSVYWRELGKYDHDNWQQHKFDTDYEAPEEDN